MPGTEHFLFHILGLDGYLRNRLCVKQIFVVGLKSPRDGAGGSPAACRGGGGPLIRNAGQYFNFARFRKHFLALAFKPIQGTSHQIAPQGLQAPPSAPPGPPQTSKHQTPHTPNWIRSVRSQQREDIKNGTARDQRTVRWASHTKWGTHCTKFKHSTFAKNNGCNLRHNTANKINNRRNETEQRSSRW